MIIENQNASYRFAIEIGRHRWCDDSVNLPSLWACGMPRKLTADVRHPNPFRMFSSAWARSCAWVAVVIKSWSFHAARYGCPLTDRYCTCAGIFNLPPGVSLATSYGRAVWSVPVFRRFCFRSQSVLTATAFPRRRSTAAPQCASEIWLRRCRICLAPKAQLS
jgi:hypothetical protein